MGLVLIQGLLRSCEGLGGGVEPVISAPQPRLALRCLRIHSFWARLHVPGLRLLFRGFYQSPFPASQDSCPCGAS